MTDCKNCKYTDEYCASGDCNKIQANNLACNEISLTEQWKKGELKLGEHYYYTTIFSPTVHIQNFTRDVVSFQDFKETVAEVLAPVPSYDEWKASYNCMLENEVLRLKNAQLKELLKEWVQFEIEENPNDFTVMSERMSELANKTKEVLKCQE